MLEAVVWCSGINVVASTELFQKSKPLELWGVYNPHTQRRKLNVAVDRIIKNLHKTWRLISFRHCRLASECCIRQLRSVGRFDAQQFRVMQEEATHTDGSNKMASVTSQCGVSLPCRVSLPCWVMPRLYASPPTDGPIQSWLQRYWLPALCLDHAVGYRRTYIHAGMSLKLNPSAV